MGVKKDAAKESLTAAIFELKKAEKIADEAWDIAGELEKAAGDSLEMSKKYVEAQVKADEAKAVVDALGTKAETAQRFYDGISDSE